MKNLLQLMLSVALVACLMCVNGVLADPCDDLGSDGKLVVTVDVGSYDYMDCAALKEVEVTGTNINIERYAFKNSGLANFKMMVGGSLQSVGTMLFKVQPILTLSRLVGQMLR